MILQAPAQGRPVHEQELGMTWEGPENSWFLLVCHLGVSINMGTPKWMVSKGKSILLYKWWRFPKLGLTQISYMTSRIVHYKPSILGYPH